MMFRFPVISPKNKAAVWLSVALAFGHVSMATPVSAQEVTAPQRAELALMGTIQIYWGEAHGGLDAIIAGDTDIHWARAQLERDFALRPLDYLTAEGLEAHAYLLMAQPRGLTPEENVALDDWVQAGGRLLLLADPVMTGHSHYGLGDRRRPQDTALLSPILAHWGLELLFDADQAEGLQMREFVGGVVGKGDSVTIPVNLPGHLKTRDSGSDCTLNPAEILAFCRIGAGQVTVLADAALLDLNGPWPGAEAAFLALRESAFGLLRENVGQDVEEGFHSGQTIENTLEVDKVDLAQINASDPPKHPPDP